MKNLSMIVWFTQLGLSVALPLVGFIWGAVYLRDRFGLGTWIIWIAVLVGFVCAVDGFRSSLKAMRKMTEEKNDFPVSYNDHD